MFTDIVGYSSMVSRDEKGAMELLSIHDKIIEPILDDHGGEIIKKIGDSIFARFKSPLEGVETAIKIQQKMKKRNSISDSQYKFQIRIGLHAGSVIEKDNDLFGHDVNLCSRIESIAPRGGIAASHDIIQACEDNNNLHTREMGHVKLKNIPNPQQIYKIYPDSQEYDAETPKSMQRRLIENGVNIVDIDKYEPEDTFSIAILYINNLGADEGEMIAYNLTEHLTSDLEYINSVRTPAFNDILEYKGKGLSTSDIARKMEVDNVLRGSMLKKEDTLHLSFDLIDINSGKVLWENKWTELIINEKNIRRHIISSILEIFKLQLTDQLAEIYSDDITNNGQALEMYYKAKWYSVNMQSKSDLEQGCILLESAIKLDENFVLAYSLYALVLQRLGHYSKAEMYLDKGKKISHTKADLHGLALIHSVSNIFYYTQGKYQKARENIEKALEYEMQLNNNLTLAKMRSNYAQCLNQLNEIDPAIEQNKLAIKLKEELEDNKSLATSYGVLAGTYFSKGDFSLALINGIKSLAMCRANHMTNFEGRLSVIIADTLLHIGKYKEMISYAEEAESILADFDEPFLMGKLELMYSHSCLNEGDLDAAMDHVDSCIDLFEIAEQIPFLLDAYIHKMQLFLEQNALSKAKRLMSRIEMQVKKLAGGDAVSWSGWKKIGPQLEIFRLLLSSDNLAPEIIREIKSQLSLSPAADRISAYWHLAGVYKSLEDFNAAKESLKKAMDIINQQAMIISNEEDRDCFINKVYLHKRISGELSKSALDYLNEDSSL